jgi:hypothetical protein
MNTTRTETAWIKARRSSANSDCVEMRRHGEAVQVRDSKHTDGEILTVPADQFAAWVVAARRGEFPTGS